jgi:hypothetical protein
MLLSLYFTHQYSSTAKPIARDLFSHLFFYLFFISHQVQKLHCHFCLRTKAKRHFWTWIPLNIKWRIFYHICFVEPCAKTIYQLRRTESSEVQVTLKYFPPFMEPGNSLPCSQGPHSESYRVKIYDIMKCIGWLVSHLSAYHSSFLTKMFHGYWKTDSGLLTLLTAEIRT